GLTLKIRVLWIQEGNMPEVRDIEQDLGFVREVVEKSERAKSPAAVYLLWALIVPVGFALADFRPQVTGLFWLIAGPVGFLPEPVIGSWDSRKRGQVDGREGTRHLLHWGGMIGAILLTFPLSLTGSVTERGLGQVVLLVVALAYFLNGIYLDRPNLWIGVLMAAGYLLTFVVTRYVWTLMGAMISGALIASALREMRRGATVPASS